MSYSCATGTFEMLRSRHFLVSALFLTSTLGASGVQAQGMSTDIVNVSIGHLTNGIPAGYNDYGFLTNPPTGAVSPLMTSNGYQYNEIFYDNSCADPLSVLGMCLVHFHLFVFAINASADPGQSFLTSISNGTATLQGSAATYNYDTTSQVASWTFNGTSDTFGFASASSEQLTIVHD